eukprot:4851087-Prymnesium_polylepis.3
MRLLTLVCSCIVHVRARARQVRMLVSQQEQLRESRTSCAGCVDADEQRVTQREAQLSRLTQRSSVGMKV